MTRISLSLLVLLLSTSGVLAQPVPTHSVRPGDTLTSIAQRYYNDPTREEVIRRANDLLADPILLPGDRLVIPMSTFYRVKPSQTWKQIAEEVYGQSFRASVLVEANEASLRVQPDEGTELLVPFPLRHVALASESVAAIAQMYFGEGRRHVTRIRWFNALNNNRLQRGTVILVPMVGLELSDEALTRLGKALQSATFGARTQQAQLSAEQEVPKLMKMVRAGSFAETVALGNGLLGTGRLTSTQRVDIHRALATSYVALDRQDMAVQSFLKALRRQPSLELDSVTTSPKVLKAFVKAKALLTKTNTPSPAP